MVVNFAVSFIATSVCPGTLRKHETSSGTVLLGSCSSHSTWEDYLFANWSYLACSGSPIRCSIQLVRGPSTLNARTLSLSMNPLALGVESHSCFGSRVGAYGSLGE